jgi:hypothetical protein
MRHGSRGRRRAPAITALAPLLSHISSFFSSILCSVPFYFSINYFRCGPCKMFAPIFERLANEYPQAQFVKVDVDQLEDVAAQAGVSAMPTFQVRTFLYIIYVLYTIISIHC